MDETRSEPVVSGRDYSVDDVRGRPATGLGDFEGETSFSLTRGPHRHEVVGVGTVVDGMALVHEKQGVHGGGLDVRVWQVTAAPGGFAAQHVAEF
ncbi:hypothetical protein FHR75_000877 [Kineococcus radiotolerans]|uniref:Uncharacterized protein n=2 Tax=Kineococcus radiotolerans TaxID=131568 RepID=A6W7D2_KINRD|nr:hypothetical protein [Kineococcus radiotolerans]ABS02721.1 hypothetical protein Krad_1233 [Kineococcus radiotolerans SRS30216 = ATCC BAA-149]MBB2900089.1 hypothetical protein [Kineococcus radiotolerans]